MIRTLIVDDDFAVAGMHRRFVEALEGFEVAGVLERGLPVAGFLAEHEVDLVLLDVHLPDRSGVQVLEDLRAAGSDVAVIMVTAASERDTVRRAVGHGVDGYLVKPFSRDEFNDRLLAFAALYAEPAGAEQDTLDGGELDQAEIDRLVRGAAGLPPREGGAAVAGTGTGAPGDTAGASGATLPTRLPKGFSAPTLRRVADALREAGAGVDRSAREVAEACGISRVSARRYLDLMAGHGLAELRPRYGATGRPEHRYVWTGG
ncbi:response regulator [Citricoccus sp. SGAir0253]|uniref:response regulator n=1 Tax=Citricoccus sp. SGAir0253 TaxID=2567881 RepID=UPI0010CD3FF7|nr:response regulator [Citricoccus sp. SGAir0253]QCU77132.1 response regulator [Citricoccus sp. SGAir0253]